MKTSWSDETVMNARRFLFGDDFRAPPPGEQAASRETEWRDEGYRQGYAAGIEEGRRLAAADAEERVADALGRIAQAAEAGAAGIARALAAAGEAIAFFGAGARRRAGHARAVQPIAAVADAAGVAFRHLRGVPHIAVRV